LKTLTNGTSTSNFDGTNNPMKTPKKLISVDLEYQVDVYDIERLVEATRILLEVLGEEIDADGNGQGSS
jgi:hypothetical protein